MAEVDLKLLRSRELNSVPLSAVIVLNTWRSREPKGVVRPLIALSTSSAQQERSGRSRCSLVFRSVSVSKAMSPDFLPCTVSISQCPNSFLSSADGGLSSMLRPLIRFAGGRDFLGLRLVF